MKSLINVLRYLLTHPLGRRNKIATVKRFFFYQISKLFNPYPIVYPFTNKSKLIVERGMTGATGNIYCGLQEFEDMSFLLHLLRPDDLFVDVGANVGSYTILASGHAGSRTMAFEPVPSTYLRLSNNISINNLGEKVKAYNIGIGAGRGVLRFTSDLDTVNHVLLENEEGNSIEVRIESLGHLLAEQIPVLIKIDVEGYETEVIKGAMSILQNPGVKAIIIELNGSGIKYGYQDEWIHTQLLQLGFSPYQYDPFTRTLRKLQYFGKYNTLYLRDADAIQEKLTGASPFLVYGFTI